MTLNIFINILLTMKKNRIIYIPLILSFVLSGCNQTEKKETPIVSAINDLKGNLTITGNYNQAFKILKDFKIQKIEPFVLFNMLAREYRNMLLIKEAASNTKTKNTILTTLNLQKWQQDKYLKNGSNYSKKSLEKELVNLANIDLDIKTGKIDKYLALEMYLINHNA